MTEVPAGKDVPYSFKNDFYIRVGDKTLKADTHTIRDLVLRRQTEPERWERRFSDARMDIDLNDEHLFTTAETIQKVGRTMFHDIKNRDAILEDLSCAKYGRLTNAGDLLFCGNITSRTPQARVKAVRFTIDKRDDTYRDIRQFEGPLLQVLEDVFSFILSNTPLKATFSGGKLKRDSACRFTGRSGKCICPPGL